MKHLVLRVVDERGGKACLVPVARLRDLKNDIEVFRQSQELNGFQQYIVTEMYRLDPPELDFPVRSVLVIATPMPAYARVTFEWKGEVIPAVSPARSYPGKEDAITETKRYLTEYLEPKGYHAAPADSLPLKRLAVCGGLALYGRNNITYVEGMGSFQTLAAYYTDVPCVGDDWREVRQMDCCESCLACVGNCPTGALRRDRFLIDNVRCLSFMNEFPGEFPDWLPPSAHHCLYDCLMCQNVCPANHEQMDNVIGTIEFNDAETEAILSELPLNELQPALQAKIRFLGMDQWYNAIPRNIRALFENHRQGRG